VWRLETNTGGGVQGRSNKKGPLILLGGRMVKEKGGWLLTHIFCAGQWERTWGGIKAGALGPTCERPSITKTTSGLPHTLRGATVTAEYECGDPLRGDFRALENFL